VTPHTPPSAAHLPHTTARSAPAATAHGDWVGPAISRTSEEEGSRVQAYVLYRPRTLSAWWIATFWRVPKTRVVGGTDAERRCHWMTHRSSSVRTRSLRAHALFWRVRQMRALGASVVASWRNRDGCGLRVMEPDLSSSQGQVQSRDQSCSLLSKKGGPLFVYTQYVLYGQNQNRRHA
jgi:hypothetical protein